MLVALVLRTGDLSQGNLMKAFILLVVGLQSLLICGETNEVNWAAGIPLALGSVVEAHLAAKLITQEWEDLDLALACARGCSSYLAPDSGR